MKRSEINQVIRETEALLSECGLFLPPFFSWTPKEWEEKGRECDEIRDNGLGWDVTDYGCGDFAAQGLTALTIRNGNTKKPEKYAKPYAEKLLIVREGQVTPLHFHWYKMEDIINRAGGTLMMRLYNSTEDERPDLVSPVRIVSDGVVLSVPAGGTLALKPGQSVTFTQGMYHTFWAEEGGGTVVVGEVSMCNDDNTDNCFWNTPRRYPLIEEDEAPYRLLCNEYPLAKE
ncbi:MAG: D-lyxose/D-mannose family sugar isomerase [Lachnospiraceae bacterium]|nr:D-lyxose/D-mannose family sugar isomerase [Lachnospiraceae bacterium]